MRINFDFLDLEAFLAVKETASFHAASQRLNLSQSSVTRRVQKLEQALGSTLFDRTTRDVRPTLAAKRLQIRAEAILQDAREATQAMRDESVAFASQRAQTVTIATVPTVVTGLVAPAIRTFRADGNRARIRLLDMAANEVAEAVSQGEADFGLCSIPMVEPMTEFTHLFDEPIVLAMPRGHPLADRKRLRWSDLQGDALILPARGTGNRLMIDEALARSGTPVRWSYEVGRTSTALNLVVQRMGIAPLPRMAVLSEENGGITWNTVSEPEVSRPIGLVTRPGLSETPAEAALKAAVLRQVETLRS